MKPRAEVSPKKIKIVKELEDLIKSNRTILIASVKNLPASQFQEIGKKLRGKAVVKIPRKSLMIRAIEDSGDEKLKKIEKYVQDSTAVLFSDDDSFELAAELIQNKSPAKAKAGQIAPGDIEVEAGPTELVPGPAISELGALGIQIQIEKGKITIKAPKVIVKAGEKISDGAASLMNKLDMKPFSIGFVPLSAFDTKEKKLYSEITIDTEETLNSMKASHRKALGFAARIGFAAEDTIGLLLARASAYANKINRIATGEPEPVAEVPAEEKKEIKEEKEEPKASAAESAAGLAGLFG